MKASRERLYAARAERSRSVLLYSTGAVRIPLLCAMSHKGFQCCSHNSPACKSIGPNARASIIPRDLC